MTEIQIPEVTYDLTEKIKKKKYKNVPQEPVDVYFVQEI